MIRTTSHQLFAWQQRLSAPALATALLTTLSGCGSDDAGAGSLDLAASGGMALEQGFPHTEGGQQHAFADGWSVTFTKYVVTMGQVRLTDPNDGAALVGSWDAAALLDLRAGGGNSQPLTTLTELPASRLDLQFDLLAATASMENRNVAATDADAMVQNGWTYYVEGEATKEARTVTFKIGLDGPTHYYDCTNGKDGTKGIAIEANKTVGAFIYAHPHHLFWDTLAAGDEELRFDAWAAVAGADDEVTAADLAGQDLTDLHDANGDSLLDQDGNPVYYDSGTALQANEQNLLAFVRYAARASVHFNGVGLCNMQLH